MQKYTLNWLTRACNAISSVAGFARADDGASSATARGISATAAVVFCALVHRCAVITDQ